MENPSAWHARLPVAALAAAGFVIATYLALYQAGVLRAVWEPFFGAGSRTILRSSLARALPIPDAALGAAAYACEVLLDLLGDEMRWRRAPRLVVLFGLLVAATAAGSLGLVLAQALVFRAWCTLCLTSAALSWLVVLLASREVLAAYDVLRGRRRHTPAAGR